MTVTELINYCKEHNLDMNTTRLAYDEDGYNNIAATSIVQEDNFLVLYDDIYERTIEDRKFNKRNSLY